ncbi:Trk system potassium uptake protein TrkG [Aquimixticola soesokkakensis]|uniref:Trk system potassium uptake protein TrkG n=1 Tax=Aquimixticola soesokkakensis TaxID=1519096 RepID=A0A1Y5SJP4_9RHOB|nr:potassium transporter TrkG [Aquimixticola soesokkakensis]SLN41716.1 Trk system potassium uptake protein TrkG [Aquimixticola soesokkakensis]
MLARLVTLPLFVILMGMGAALMFVPALFGLINEEFADARAFFYGGVIFLILASFVGIASANRVVKRQSRAHLLTLLAAYTVLPLILAVPVVEGFVPVPLFDAWWEMVSAFTTTGASLAPDPGAVTDTQYLWRALVGWAGGFFAWVTAIAILAPLNLGGFEVLSDGGTGQTIRSTTTKRIDSAMQGSSGGFSQITRVADTSERLLRYTGRLFPIYTGLTLVLWLALAVTGTAPFVAFCHAASTLATSGISPAGGLTETRGGFFAEALIFAFMWLAISRKTFTSDHPTAYKVPLSADPEMKMALLVITVLPLLLFVRHFIGVVEVEGGSTVLSALSALWGGVFMVLSFLTTTGFESASWEASRLWSDLTAPGLLLVGLAMMGGGVATTAGGMKLLRVYALIRHGERELEKMVMPHSVGGAGAQARRIRRQGAYVAWVFFILFASAVSGVMLALSLFGVGFDQAVALSVAALTTTGPLAQIAPATPVIYASLSDPVRVILAFAMIVGRLETLAFVAILNPEFWR